MVLFARASGDIARPAGHAINRGNERLLPALSAGSRYDAGSLPAIILQASTFARQALLRYWRVSESTARRAARNLGAP